MKTFFKILLIGIVTTACRIMGQLMIPQGPQAVLLPSVFVINGTMPIAFTVYGILAYSLIAALFLLIRNGMSGNRILQGVKFGLSCCAVWVAYLFEPLPHVAPIDRITYPLADGAALLVMGLLAGILFGSRSNVRKADVKPYGYAAPIAAITMLFVAGRTAQYLLFDIYSSFHAKTTETMIWCICTGFIVACSLSWLNRHIETTNKLRRICILGLLLFGLDLTLFNFFMPLVFNADMFDLILRTALDILFVSAGCLAFLFRGQYAV